MGSPDERVAALLKERVETLEELEALLLLRTLREPPRPARGIAETLRVPLGVAEAALGHLRDHGLAASSAEGYVYRPDTPEIAAAVEALVLAYEDSRLEIIRQLNANAMERVRSRALRLFADAFLLRRKRDG